MDDKEATFDASKQVAIQQTPIVKVTDIRRFNGEHAYDVVFGYTNQEQYGYAFIPIDKKLKIEFLFANDGLSKKEMLVKWKNECGGCTLESITPGIAKGNFIWEVIFKDNKDNFVFSYYLFSTGSLYEQLK